MKNTIMAKRGFKLKYCTYRFPESYCDNDGYILDDLVRAPFTGLNYRFTTRRGSERFHHLEIVPGTDIAIATTKSGKPNFIAFNKMHLIEHVLLWAKSKYSLGVSKLYDPKVGQNILTTPTDSSLYKLYLHIPELNIVASFTFLAEDVTIKSVLGDVTNERGRLSFWGYLNMTTFNNDFHKIRTDSDEPTIEILKPEALIYINSNTISDCRIPGAMSFCSPGNDFIQKLSSFGKDPANKQFMGRLKHPLVEEFAHPQKPA